MPTADELWNYDKSMELFERDLRGRLDSDRFQKNHDHGGGTWDVADVMAIVWPEFVRMRELLEQLGERLSHFQVAALRASLEEGSVIMNHALETEQ